MELDFYFDFGSPASYLAYKRLRQLESKYDLTVHWLPMLLGGVFKATGNVSPVTVAAKGNYMVNQDFPRFAKRYSVPMQFNPYFPINTLNLMRGAVAAQDEGVFDRYADAVFDAMWQEQLDLGQVDVVVKTLQNAGLDAMALLELTQSDAIKQTLIANTNQAIDRGVFGAPTMFVGDEMYFGQDRLDFIEADLKADRGS
ncbi:2-hydroxychromene-2-carboxylate isomerase [Aequoribacter fuscus]|uniref:2-hydroxychromene-2-carboxylate isomerase n=1 Tax=Aequoribacter fuscus TaxID=2518989 RepID=F3KZE7_9GAMM|nr:2-hydroxychromene-2-carboxylate isomerase [Aequoribacter fuscus]EGG30634.1 2-hydroxychromene-2-carboxylate isomerase [Aequoribacter fuscus]QHJ87528.1 2-hydroxychromene-2-carboxylate isomerase [Aequoribacter fuscus]